MPTLKMTEEKMKLLENLCCMKPTFKDCGVILGVDTSTIVKWIKRKHKMTFYEFRAKKIAWTRNMIACESIQRKCNLIEMSKHYCDVIINR